MTDIELVKKAKEAARIRARYVEKERTELDELKELDKRVTRPVSIFSYVLGSIGAIVMGAGMSLVMTDIGNTAGIPAAMAVGIAVGIVGLAISVINYPLHRMLLEKRKQKYSSEILSISEKLINEN